MFAREFMDRNFSTINGNALISEADKIMRNSKLRQLLVVDGSKVVGLIDHRLAKERIRQAMKSEADLSDQLKVKDAMRRNVVCVTPDTPVEKLMAIGQNYGVGTFAVIKDDLPLGVITMMDLIKFAIQDFGFVGSSNRPCLFIRCEEKLLPRILDIVNRTGAQILTLHHVIPHNKTRSCTIYLDTDSAEEIVDALMSTLAHREYRAEEPVTI